MKRKLRVATDIAMTVLMPLLMAYSLIGEVFHEIIGTAMFVLFIIHHIMNRKWYGAVLRGGFDAARVFRTVLNALLLVFMLLQPLSGVLLSRHLYAFWPALPLSAQARSLHLLLAYWGYVLLCIHAGTHLTAPLAQLQRQDRKAGAAVLVLFACISVYGGFAFVKRGFPGYMFAKTAFAFFDYSEPPLFFILDHLAVMALFMLAGSFIIKGLSSSAMRRKGKAA